MTRAERDGRGERAGRDLYLAVLPAVLVAGLLGCGGETGPPQPLTFAAVSAGGFHTCGLTSSGAAYCWGFNGNGQLGDGTTTDRSVPVVVAGGRSFAALSAGFTHTCGLTTGGVAYCWGNNADGQLGNVMTTSGSSVPVAVSGALSLAALSAGGDHTCAVTTTGGVAYCWGNNASGQLGNGTTSGSSVPVAVSGALSFAALSAGLDHTCGVTTGGLAYLAYCWGSNSYGQLGNGTMTDKSAPGLAAQSIAALSAGFTHTCGVATFGVAYCWGNNSSGQLGNGTTTSQLSPVPVEDFAAVSAGGAHTCGLTTGGLPYCWGDNSVGQLGNGMTANGSAPGLVSGALSFAALSAGQNHTCGVTPAGAAYCWGYNSSGQLGDGTTTNSSVPVPVSGT